MSNILRRFVTLILLLVNLSLRTKQGYTITIDTFRKKNNSDFLPSELSRSKNIKIGWSEAWPTKEFEKFQENKIQFKKLSEIRII